MKTLLFTCPPCSALGLCMPSFSNPCSKQPFFFEDAAGHRDTIVVGYDTSANFSFNPQFGEIDIEAPFRSGNGYSGSGGA